MRSGRTEMERRGQGYTGSEHEGRDQRVPVVILFEPAADKFSYESKFVPLLGKYLDPSFFKTYVVGSAGLKVSLSGTDSVPLELPIGFIGHRGASRFLLYVTSLALSSLLLIKAIKISQSRILVTMAGHCYSGFVVAVVGRIIRRKTIVRISEPTRLLLKRNRRPTLLYVLTSWTEKLSLSLSDVIFSVRDMSDYCVISPSKDRIIPQGVDILGIESSQPALLEKHFSPTIVTVSRLDSEKGVHRLIDSVALLIRRFPEMGCLIVGWGPELNSLRRQVSERGLDGKVVFKGYVPPSLVPSMLKSCDIFVLPSELEGVPSAVLEAMACGLPVVMCLRTGSFAESVVNSNAVLRVVPTPEAISDAIQALWVDPEQRSKVARAGLEFVKEKYDEKKSRKEFFHLVSQLTSGTALHRVSSGAQQ